MTAPTKIGSVTVKATMLVEFTHHSSWSSQETVEHLHKTAVEELRRSIENYKREDKIRIIKIESVRSVTNEEKL